MFISDVAVKRPVFATVIALILIVFGAISFTRLPVRQYPKIDEPQVSVTTSYIGASANVVETRVTQVIEDQLSGIEGIKTIESSSRDGRSNVTITFRLSRDLDEAANDVRDRVSRALGRLPVDVDPPQVQKADADGRPVIWFSLVSSTLDRIDLVDYASRVIVRRLSIVDGVANVFVGGSDPGMRIWLDRLKLAAYELTALDIENALRNQNVELPGGIVEAGARDFPVRVARGYLTADDFRALVIREEGDGRVVRLGDVAEIERGPENPRQLFRSDGQENVGLGIVPQSNTNQVALAQAVRKEMESLRATLPEGMEIRDSYDRTAFVRAAIIEVWRTLAITVLLVLGVIYLFLGKVRSALIPAAVVPVCLISAFIALAAFGFSINIITLLALVLAIGLVVDDAIVVLENIERRIGLGEPPLAAAYRGARQVGFAVLATTLVLISVFVSLAFLEGFVGRIFRELALTISAAVAFSSLLALTLSPMMASKLLKAERGDENRLQLSKMFTDFFDRLGAAYVSGLEMVVKRPMCITGFLLFTCLAGGFLFTNLPRDLEPPEDRGGFFAVYRFAEGAGKAHALEQIQKVEEKMSKIAESGDLARFFVISPAFGQTNFSGAFGFNIMAPWGERDRSSADVFAEFRREVNAIPGVQAFGSVFPGLQRGGAGEDINFVLMGPDYDTLERWAEAVLAKARQNPNLSGLRTDYFPGTPQLRVEIDKDRAADLGVSATDVGRTLELLMASRRVGTYADRGEEYDVVVQAQDTDRNAFTDLLNYTVRTTQGELIPLSNLVEYETFADSPQRNRLNRLRSISITGQLAPGYTQGEALAYLETTVAEELAGEDVQIGYLGGSLQFKEAGSAFLFVFIMALLIVYLVLAAQFESFIHPFVIMLTVPAAVTGGLAALYLTDGTLNIYSQIGLVILVGLAAKNGILIVEFANQLRDQGVEVLEASLEAARTRFRPILMTGLSTAIGAVPLMIAAGPGAQSRAAIGIVIFSGVMFATLITLFVVPTFYALLARFTGSPGRIARLLSEWEASQNKPGKGALEDATA